MEINFSSQVIFLPLSMSFAYLKHCPSLYFLPASASHFLLFPFLFLSCLRLSFYLSVSIPQRLSVSCLRHSLSSLLPSLYPGFISHVLSPLHLPLFLPVCPSISFRLFVCLSVSAGLSLSPTFVYTNLFIQDTMSQMWERDQRIRREGEGEVRMRCNERGKKERMMNS